MNQYAIEFFINCPKNGIRIKYMLMISTPGPRVIMVEDITAFVDTLKSEYHEAMADKFYSRFGGIQIMRGHHHGVDITTTRGARTVATRA